MSNVLKPKKGESVRHIEQTTEDRNRQVKEFRDKKDHEQKVKEERFTEIRKRRKSSGGSGGNINVKVGKDV